MKKVVAMVFALMGALVFAGEVKWTGGAGDGRWYTTGNWEGGTVPTGSDVAVFENENPITVTMAEADPLVKYAGLTFNGADVTINTDRSLAPSDNTVYFVKEGTTASLVGTAGVQGFVYAVKNATKTGKGKLVVTEFRMDENNPDTLFDLAEGAFEVRKMAVLSQVHVWGGATFFAATYNAVVGNSLRWQIDEGATVLCNGLTSDFSSKSILAWSGAGVFNGTNLNDQTHATVLRLAPSSAYGASVFGGSFGNLAQVVLETTATAPFVLGAADVILNANRFTGSKGLSFLPGVGTFNFGTGYYCDSTAPLNLADTNGAPVRVNWTPSGSTPQMQAFWTTGPGDVYLKNTTTTLTGDRLQHTGTLGYEADGQTLTFGDGTAANDFDFAALGAIDGVAGTVKFKNATETPVAATVKGAATFEFSLNTTLNDYSPFGSLAYISKTLTLAGGLAGTARTTAFSFAADNATLVVSGDAVIHAKDDTTTTYENLSGTVPLGSLLNGHNGTSTLRVEGGDFWTRNPKNDATTSYYGAKNYVLKGGRLHLGYDTFYATVGTTEQSPTYFDFDGGTLCISHLLAANYQDKVPFADVAATVLRVKEGGANLTDEHVYSRTAYCNEHPIRFNRPLKASVDAGKTDGGVTQRGFNAFDYKYPLDIAGPFTGIGSATIVSSQAELDANGCYFGSGDTCLKNHVILLSGRTDSAFAFRPQGLGKALRVTGAGALELRDSKSGVPAHVTIDNLDVGEGDALFLYDAGGMGADGKSTVRLGTAPATAANGRVLANVFGTSNAQNTDRRFAAGLLGYDPAIGFTNLVFNSSVYGAGRLVFIESSTAACAADTTNEADVLLMGQNASTTLATGSKIIIGTAGQPGVLFLNVGGIKGENTASLEFAGTRGLIVCNVDGSEHDCASFIQVPIRNANGLSVVSYPDIAAYGWRGVRLGAANSYSGVTRVASAVVQAEHPGCFSAGDVYALDGDRYGGGIRFNCAGATWANNFHVAGRGIRQTVYEASGYDVCGAALAFWADGKVSGSVEMGAVARMNVKEGVTGEISGVVTGGKLEVVYSKGSLRLTGHNTYSGGTDVVNGSLDLGQGDAAGTGPIWLNGGTLRFVNEHPIVFSNRIWGTGTIEILGAPVTFVGADYKEISGKTLARGSTLDVPAFASCTLKSAAVVPDGGTLDLHGENLTVSEVWGSGTVVGGTLTVTDSVNPAGIGTIGSLIFAQQPVLTGARLVIDTADGAVDRVTVPGDLDLSAIALEVVQSGQPVVFQPKAFLQSGGLLVNAFKSVILPVRKTRNYGISVGVSEATLGYAKPGLLLMVR